MSEYHVRVVDQNDNFCYYLNADSTNDIYKQAYNFVNDNPDTSMIGIEGKEIFVRLTSYTCKPTSIGIIGDNAYNPLYTYNAYNAYNVFNTSNTLNAEAIKAFNTQNNETYNAYNAYNAQSHNAHLNRENNAYNPNIHQIYNLYHDVCHIQRNELKKIALSIVSEHTKKYGDNCKFGNKCKFNCKFGNKCNRKICVHHHFPIN